MSELRKKRKPDQKKKHLLPAAIRIFISCFAGAVLICSSVYWLNSRTNGFARGLEYLKTQAQKDTGQVSSLIDGKQKERMVRAVKEEGKPVFSLFKDALLLGDSRMYGFFSYGFVPPDQVCADAGKTINNIEEYLDVIKAAQPKTIYFSYGVNEMGLGIGGEESSGYADIYEAQIDKVLEVSSDSVIVVNSIIPTTRETLEQNPRWNKTEDYNR